VFFSVITIYDHAFIHANALNHLSTSTSKQDFADNEWENQAYMRWAKQDNETRVNVIMDEESLLGNELWEM